jgi:hypothetical protein
MMKNFMTMGALSKVKKPKGDWGRKGPPPFPEEEVLMSIYGRPAPMSLGISSSLRARKSTL